MQILDLTKSNGTRKFLSTSKNDFKKHYYNPAVCLLFRFMHDMDKPLGVEQDQLDDIVSTKSIASTCPECEQNINSTRYRWGNMTRVINSDILRKIMMMIQFLCDFSEWKQIHNSIDYYRIKEIRSRSNRNCLCTQSTRRCQLYLYFVKS